MKNVKSGHAQPIICLDAGHYGKYNRSPAIPEYYGMPEPGNRLDKGVLYRVQTGAYKVKSNADAQLKKIKAAGFDAIITNENGMYKTQSGAYGIKANAERQLAKLRAAGFDAFIG